MAIPVCLAYDLLVLQKRPHKAPNSRQTSFTRRGIVLILCGLVLLILRFKLMHRAPRFSTYVCMYVCMYVCVCVVIM